jgi:hypothetical protein
MRQPTSLTDISNIGDVSGVTRNVAINDPPDPIAGASRVSASWCRCGRGNSVEPSELIYARAYARMEFITVPRERRLRDDEPKSRRARGTATRIDTNDPSIVSAMLSSLFLSRCPAIRPRSSLNLEARLEIEIRAVEP